MNSVRAAITFQLVFLQYFVFIVYSNSIETPAVFLGTKANNNNVSARSAEKIGIYTFSSILTIFEQSAGKSSLITFSLGGYKDVDTQYLEKAAMANKLLQKNETPKILVDTWQTSEPHLVDASHFVHTAHQANLIFPETVHGFVVNPSENPSLRSSESLSLLSKSVSEFSLKLGSRQNCLNSEDVQTEDPTKLHYASYLDFMLCEMNVDSDAFGVENKKTFSSIGTKFVKLIKSLNKEKSKNLEIIGLVPLLSNFSLTQFQEFNDPENLSEEITRSTENFNLLFVDAVDTPSSHYFSESLYYEGLFKLSVMPRILQDQMQFPILQEPTPHHPEMGISNTTVVTVIIGNLILIALFLSGMIMHAYTIKQAEKQYRIRERMELSRVSENKKLLGTATATNTSNTTLGFPYDTSLEIAWGQLDIDYKNLLGRGNFGYVCKAQIKGGSEVALKFAGIDSHRSSLMRMISEIKILTILGSHNHIVKLKGIYTAGIPDGVVYLATEICSLGCLQNHLRKDQPYNKPQHSKLPLQGSSNSALMLEEGKEAFEMNVAVNLVTFEEMVRWSSEIACGMEFIGSKNIIHADLATRNVLLTSEKITKICDFGLSRMDSDVQQNTRSHDEPLPWRWMALETLKRSEYSVQSDAWSYGVTLWEIFSLGDAPYPKDVCNREFVNQLSDGMRLHCPTRATHEIYDIMTRCWQLEPSERPSFAELFRLFKVMSKNCLETQC